MEEFSNLTVSLEKIPSKTETNRNIDETFDTNSFPSKTSNKTIVLNKDDNISPRPQSQSSTKASQFLPASPHPLTEECFVKKTPDHFLDTTPCHSTPLNGLDDVLKIAAPFVDDIEHCGGVNGKILMITST